MSLQMGNGHGMMEKKRYSMRGRIIRANVGIILTALVLCGTIFVVSVFLIVGDYIHTDMNYFLNTTADNLEAKLEYCESVIYALRDDKTVMDYLENVKKSGDGEDKEALREMARTAYEAAVDISTFANLGNGNIPIVEEIYLFDSFGNTISTSYYAMISAEKEKSKAVFEQIYETFCRQKELEGSYAFYEDDTGEFTYLVFPLLDRSMNELGKVIYKISKTAIYHMMEDTNKYERSFWAMHDERGNYIIGENSGEAQQYKEEMFKRFDNEPYRLNIGVREYRVCRKPICMDMQIIIGIPENQTMLLMYGSAKIYILLIALVTCLGCMLSFFIIYRLTRPIEEITDKLQEVKEGDFETKLPKYESIEFNEISETFNEMTAYINHLVKQVYEKQIFIKDMELKFLQTQMNPHFMFNILNTIALQAKMDGNEEVYKMISSFSQLIQAKIYRSGKEKVKIGQELEYVEYYLTLQRYRFGEHLQYEILVESEGLKELYIPKLCIQLLVENEVVHGIEPKMDGGMVRVRVYELEGAVLIDTQDNGVGFALEGDISLPINAEESDKSHNHVGLNNAHHIIQMMYGEEYGISVWSKKGQGTAIRIRIPLDDGSGWEGSHDESNAGR